jgi:hypothetical protein
MRNQEEGNWNQWEDGIAYQHILSQERGLFLNGNVRS